jgi:hypothetical protein
MRLAAVGRVEQDGVSVGSLTPSTYQDHNWKRPFVA